MGDRLWVGEPSQYVTSHLSQLTLPSLWGRLIEYLQPFWRLCIGWQVTLCDPIRQVTTRSSDLGFRPSKSYIHRLASNLYLCVCRK